MRVVTKEEFFERLMAEKRDVVSTCFHIAKNRSESKFTYRDSQTVFGLIETSYETYPTTEVHKLAN